MHIHLDPVGGLAGDMFVAAMLDTFPALEPVVRSSVRAAGLPDRFRCDLVPHADHGLTGKRFLVLENAPADVRSHGHDHDHGHQPFSAVRSSLTASPLSAGVRDHALAIFTSLAEAEAQVHGATTDTVSFHELGEWDSVADIVAAAAIIEALSDATWFVGPLPLGAGLVPSAHGWLPVPAPATALLLRGLAVRDDGIGGERVTPTGAAIARYLMLRPGKAPSVRRMLGTGFGFGTRTLPGVSNCVRALVFEPTESPGQNTSVIAIEFEVDDQSPEDLAIGLDHVRAHPQVLDVVQTPVFGKKGRVALSVRVLCQPEAEDAVAHLCFHETTTLGLRVAELRRKTLHRSNDAVDIEGRRLERKIARRGSPDRTLLTTKVEAESLRDVPGHHERERLRRAADPGQTPRG